MTPQALHRLVEAGLVEERGQKRGHTWHLSAATYRLLDRLAQQGLVEREGERGRSVSYRRMPR